MGNSVTASRRNDLKADKSKDLHFFQLRKRITRMIGIANRAGLALGSCAHARAQGQQKLHVKASAMPRSKALSRGRSDCALPNRCGKATRTRLTRTCATKNPEEASELATKLVPAVVPPAVVLVGASALIGSHALEAPLTSYFNTVGVPVIEFLAPPEWIIHWFHGLNMATVLFAMGGYGTYLGFQIRKGEGNAEAFGGEMVRELHPKLMFGMLFFFFLGGQGGLVFTLMEGRPLLGSPHAVSAFAGLALLGAQAVLGTTMKGTPAARTAHTYLGTGIMSLFAVHAALGLANGLSF